MKFCPNCGAQLSEGIKFCTECGQKIVSAPTPAPVAAPEPAPAPVYAVPAPEPAPAPEPVYAAPAPEPAPEPVYAAPAPEPAPEPAYTAPTPEPASAPVYAAPTPEPAPAPVYAAPEPEPAPVYAAPEPKPEPAPTPAKAPKAEKTATPKASGGNKKLIPIIAIAAVVVVLAIVLILTLGGGKDQGVEADWGVYEGVSCVEGGNDLGADGEWIELKAKGKAEMVILGKEFSAKWTLDGENFVLSQGGDDYKGTLKDGVMVVDILDMKYTFVKEGAADSAREDTLAPEADSAPKADAAAPESGSVCYKAISATSDGETLDAELLAMLGGCYVQFNGDGTGKFYAFGDVTVITYDESNMMAEGETIPYTIKDGVMTFGMDDGSEFVMEVTDEDPAEAVPTLGDDIDEPDSPTAPAVDVEIPDDAFVFDNYAVRYIDAELAVDEYGDDTVIINLEYINNYTESNSFAWASWYTIYQDGQELFPAYIYINEYDTISDNQNTEIEPGETCEVTLTYGLINTYDPVELTFTDVYDSKTETVTIDVFGLPNNEANIWSSLDATGIQKWAGDWYGWWIIDTVWEGDESLEGSWWDCCATLELDADGNGHFTLWDENYTKYDPMAEVGMTVTDTDGVGRFVSEEGYFLDGDVEHGDWLCYSDDTFYGDVMNFSGEFESPDGELEIWYSVYLRPWGTDWSDIETEEPEMMPYYYYDWYLPLIESGETEAPESIGY
ncbi:MAG: DUF5067 domain-containing protein [Ruminococcaceae bacterium]|nr:DUF5067 domain-containing protein [Oscillospiraceae bacterium]